MENQGQKLETDSDENSEDINASSGEEEIEGVEKKKKEVQLLEQSKEHQPLKKSDEQIKKSLFLGEKFGHYKIGTYVRIEIQVEKKFSRQLKPE